MILFLLGIGGLAVILFGRALYHHAAVRSDWEFITSPWASDIVENYEVKAASEEAAIRSAYRRAVRAEEQGFHAEAVRLMDLGLRLIETTADDWMTLLRATICLSRMANAVTPLSPVNAWAFSLPALTGLALVASAAHYMLITTGERLRLRAHVLRGCWAVARNRLFRSADQIRSGKNAWGRLEDARRDIATTREETLRSFHAVLLSMGARPTPAALATEARRF